MIWLVSRTSKCLTLRAEVSKKIQNVVNICVQVVREGFGDGETNARLASALGRLHDDFYRSVVEARFGKTGTLIAKVPYLQGVEKLLLAVPTIQCAYR